MGMAKPDKSARQHCPANVEQITPQWLTNALRQAGALKGATITKIEQIPFDCLPSYFSKIAKLKLGYDRFEPDAPQTLIVKAKPEIEQQRMFERQFRAFVREIHFYQEVASTSGINLPRCFYSCLDDTAGNGIILFEDLSALSCGDQLAGLPYPHAVSAIEQIAKLHARWWNSDKLAELSWVPWDNYTLAADYGKHWPMFNELYRSKLSQNALDVGEQVAWRMNDLLQLAKGRSHTLVHCDFRADNLRIDPARPEKSVILDWQLITVGLATFDLVRMLCESIDLELTQHANLVDIWRKSLHENGVAGYAQDEAWFDYKLALLIALYIPVINASLLTGASERTAKLIDIMAHRFFRCAEILELEEFVRHI